MGGKDGFRAEASPFRIDLWPMLCWLEWKI